MRSTIPLIDRNPKINRLAAELGRLESSGEPSARAPMLELGWPGPDTITGGGLRLGAVHEWLSGADVGRHSTPQGWIPALSILGHIASRAIRANADRGRAVWIGARVQPHGAAFRASPELLAHSLFVSSDPLPERVWAIDLACRSTGVAVVLADGTGLGMSESRRLQLAAASGGTLCLLARPRREHKEISAAWTRWHVAPAETRATTPRWNVQLLRCKGAQAKDKEAWQWGVQRDHETSDVSVVPELRDRPGSETRPAFRASA